MTTPIPAGATTKLGPGVLTVGATGSEIDASDLVNNAVITMSKNEEDAVFHLSGTSTPGAVTYTFALEGNLDIDPTETTGLFALSWSAPGQEVPFTFTPNTAEGTAASGVVVLDPLDFGADAYGATLNSDFSWTIKDKPVFTRGAVAA